MRRDENSGVRSGLVDPRGCARVRVLARQHRLLGPALWLLRWLVACQTSRRGRTGIVLNGRALSLERIAGLHRVSQRTVHRWIGRLVKHRMIRLTRLAGGGVRIELLRGADPPEVAAARRMELMVMGPEQAKRILRLGRRDAQQRAKRRAA